MLKKKVDLVYLVFTLFGFFLFMSYLYILQINENTKNNYVLIDEIETLTSLNRKFDNTLIQNLQYIDKTQIDKDLNNFNEKTLYVQNILSTIELDETSIDLYEKVQKDFLLKKDLMKKFQEINLQLTDSIQKLLMFQAYIQKRYYFSPIGVEVNGLIVNFIQASLGKKSYMEDIEKNIKRLNELKSLYKLADKDLNNFIDNSYGTLSYLNKLILLNKSKENIDLANSISEFKTFMVEYFRKLSSKEKKISYYLLLVILIFIIVLWVTYSIDKKHKLDLLRFRKAIENSDESIIITDIKRRIIYVNESFEKNSGYTKNEVLGKNPNILKSNLQSDKDFEEMNKMLYSGKKWKGEFINRRKNGEIFYEKASILPLYVDDSLNGFLAIKLDITDYIKQKNNLYEQTKKLNEAQKIAHLGSWEIDFCENKIYFSDEMYNICEIAFVTMLNKKQFIKLIPCEDREIVLDKYKNMVSNHGKNEIIHKIITPNNKIKYIQNRWYSKFDKDGKALKSSGIILDITRTKMLELENKQKQQIMFQQSKMAAMGEMLENIAHQWRQPLSVISTLASGIKIKKDFGILQEAEMIEYLDGIVQATSHMSQTIDDFRNFFRNDKKMIEFDLKETINKTLKLLSSKLKNREIEIVEDMDSVKIIGYESQIIQALLNIFANAQDALIEQDIKNKMILIECKLIDNSARISIKDNANGIAEDKLPYIFEPYFTTKNKNGTGIGLFMTYEIIVKHHSGNIEAKNSRYNYNGVEFCGAEFIITLPLS